MITTKGFMRCDTTIRVCIEFELGIKIGLLFENDRYQKNHCSPPRVPEVHNIAASEIGIELT
jgi:hypothetical protein